MAAGAHWHHCFCTHKQLAGAPGAKLGAPRDDLRPQNRRNRAPTNLFAPLAAKPDPLPQS